MGANADVWPENNVEYKLRREKEKHDLEQHHKMVREYEKKHPEEYGFLERMMQSDNPLIGIPAAIIDSFRVSDPRR